MGPYTIASLIADLQKADPNTIVEIDSSNFGEDVAFMIDSEAIFGSEED